VPEKIGAAAARILAPNHGHRYYGWAHEDGVFRFFEHLVHFTREQAYEGKYVIQTEEQNLSAVDAVRLYKELSEVERAFTDLKDVLDMRPIYHQTDNRVQSQPAPIAPLWCYVPAASAKSILQLSVILFFDVLLLSLFDG
jgi:hypothetical protein